VLWVNVMGKSSKRFAALAEKLDREQRYPLDRALDLVKECATAKFDETIEVAIQLGVNPGKGEETVRGTVSLPHGTGRTRRVVVFAKGEAATAAEEAGADRVGGEELVEEIDKGWDEFDILVAAADMMRTVGRLGKKLGPRMPNKKAGTIAVTPEEMQRVVKELKAGRVEFKMDRQAGLHVPIGRASFDKQQLEENLGVLLDAIVRARPAAAKGRYIVSIALSSTMGPGIMLDVDEALTRAAA